MLCFNTNHRKLTFFSISLILLLHTLTKTSVALAAYAFVPSEKQDLLRRVSVHYVSAMDMQC